MTERVTNYTTDYLKTEARRILVAAMKADERCIYPGSFSVSWSIDVYASGARLRAEAWRKGMRLIAASEVL